MLIKTGFPLFVLSLQTSSKSVLSGSPPLDWELELTNCVLRYYSKAKLQKEGIFFLIHLFARDILLMKKLEIEETKTPKYSTFKTLSNKWMSFSYSNSALVHTYFPNPQLFFSMFLRFSAEEL